jgi:NADH-quinone oxidoreductase subunit A
VTFYLVAMIFIVFDIEIIFLYPWAVIYRELGAFGLVEMLELLGAVFVSFVYLISNGALDWGPVRRSRRLDGSLDESRSMTSTVRRIPSREAAGSRAVTADQAPATSVPAPDDHEVSV